VYSSVTDSPETGNPEIGFVSQAAPNPAGPQIGFVPHTTPSVPPPNRAPRSSFVGQLGKLRAGCLPAQAPLPPPAPPVAAAPPRYTVISDSNSPLRPWLK
jgi:hypothetical protein